MNKNIKIAFIDTIPVFTGYIMLGMGFGILLQDKGYGIIWAFFMALTMYAGSMQYVAVGLLASGASLITVAMTTLMVNARHLFYGISMIDKYKKAGIRKFYMIFALTDETYSLLCKKETPKDGNYDYFFCVSLFNQIYWITGCVLGNFLGSIITFSIEGVDFVLTALFVCIFVEQWITNKNHKPAFIGLASATLCLLIFGQESFLIPTMILIILLLLKRPKEVLDE